MNGMIPITHCGSGRKKRHMSTFLNHRLNRKTYKMALRGMKRKVVQR